MKLHSNILTEHDVESATERVRGEHKQDIYVAELVTTGSRKRKAGVSFKGYARRGRYATNGLIHGAEGARAATWSAWGYLITELFIRDPEAIIGTYNGVADFIRQCTETHTRVAEHQPKDLKRYDIGFLGANLRALAEEWNEELVDLAKGRGPEGLEGPSYGEMIERVGGYENLCDELGIDPNPDALLAYANEINPTLQPAQTEV